MKGSLYNEMSNIFVSYFLPYSDEDQIIPGQALRELYP
jgi:hypothetical protein